MTATATPLTAPSTTPKQQFIDVWTRENATTRRVLTSLPESQGEFKPHENCRTARETAYSFAVGQLIMATALTGQWSWPPKFGKAPATYAEVVSAFETSTAAVKTALESTPDSRLVETVPFVTGPKQMGEIPVAQLLWFILMDTIHHRGQLSVYLRASGAKVPSIYGPSADEPWT